MPINKEINNDINLDKINSFMKENNMSIMDFCKVVGITKYTYYKIFSGSADFGVDIIFKLAKPMKIEPKDVFIK